ncbi:hypothetical protein EDC40_101155 [Aminobacter aminovorans]|uniref:Uncharacterized protein n=1 Tax=Aminobacter aminovorans TaxID=83263 RepID=A0A380WNX5_AMIAI|nr:hypothetical protein [Aminobacter aminovorans]TCS29840.1 hypothetical protein EDC40_101155 [Aminobacter aminovorans]SUU90689.1 Uncharacterised protein [Aminobacter aminovorans]
MTEVTKLAGHRFAQADYAIGRYAATVPSDTTLADVTHPEFFANHLGVFRRGMTIDIVSDDFGLDCTLRVLAVTKTTSVVRVIRLFDEESAPKATSVDVSPPQVSFGGPHHKWRFLHGGNVIQTGFDTRDAAEKAADRYVQQMKG